MSLSNDGFQNNICDVRKQTYVMEYQFNKN